MLPNSSRREFLKAVIAGGSAVGLTDFGFLAQLPPVGAAEAQLDTNVVQFQPEIEPLVRLLEDTPREQLLEKVAARIHDGVSYREVLTALLLAGIRNVQPRPSVGFKFHAVLVVNSAHLASLASPPEHRWLPIFWALDYFKSAQAQDVRENNWTMSAVDESAVPDAANARKAFIAGMDNWDEAASDAAIAGLVRSAPQRDIFELFYRYGARDFRSIGHKAIYVANSQRTLGAIGKQHSEPVLRSLAYALLMHEGSNPARRDDPADVPWRQNIGRAKKIRTDWQEGKMDDGATKEMLATLRDSSYTDACEKVVELLNRGIAPQSVWDALLVGSGELLIRQPGIVALHAVTSTNALRYAFDATGDDETRRMLLLQNAAFVALFREAMYGRGRVADAQLDEMPAAETSLSKEELIGEIFADVSRNRMEAARKTLAYLQQGGAAQPLIDTARLVIFFKGDDAHDYKFSSAVLEDYAHVSPAWRDRYLAASMFQLHGSGDRDNPLVNRTRAALES